MEEATRGRIFSRKRASCLPLSSKTICVMGLLSNLVSGWKDCEISPEDQWKRAADPDVLPARRMRNQYDRHYTCRNREGESFRQHGRSVEGAVGGDLQVLSACLKGRRIIFLGDSLATQQGDSLVGMLGWNPEWMPLGAPRNAKEVVDEKGERRPSLLDCWHPGYEDPITGMGRCFDLYESDFPPPGQERSGEDKDGEPGIDMAPGEQREEEEEQFSVHMRMVSKPQGEQWFERALSDYNGTRPGDVIVVNFGPHFHHTPEGDKEFRDMVFPVLDEMAALKGQATVVWREISPQHFPATNGTYEAFLERNLGIVCCTGTPPKVNQRNAWVEEYLHENGLADDVKLLRIYDMSVPRGGAHHTCDFSPPTTAENRPDSYFCHNQGRKMDCTHWSETGVVEEWNSLLLNHICS